MTRRGFIQGSLGMTGTLAAPSFARAAVAPLAPMALPTAAQLEWHRQELGMFVHFGMFTYYGKHTVKNWNWRSFKDLPDPNLFCPEKLDTDQWMEAAKAFGAKYVVLVVKHCDGFMLWQNDLYPYGVRQSKWRGGKGDVLESFLASCKKYNMKPGLYASLSANAFWGVDNPGLVNHGKGGDPVAQKRYNQMCEQMMLQLWSRYGDLFEIWFDGGVIPAEKGGPEIIPILRKHQPNAVVFQGPEGVPNLIRWVGNERGVAPYPCWHRQGFTTAEGGELEKSFSGSPNGAYWIPGECDIPMRNHNWFWKEGQDNLVWSLAELMEKYDTSVGRGCNLLLNANPNMDGLIPETDFKRYAEFGAALKKRYAVPLAEAQAKPGVDTITVTLPEPMEVVRIVFGEKIEKGQNILGYEILGRETRPWQPHGKAQRILATGESVGYKRIEVMKPTVAYEITLKVTRSRGTPSLSYLKVYGA